MGLLYVVNEALDCMRHHPLLMPSLWHNLFRGCAEHVRHRRMAYS